ncbi:hypothetical protein [Bacteroides sp.]
MYHFRKLSGCYIINVSTAYPNGVESTYSAQIQLSANYQFVDASYKFELTSRHNVLLNNTPITKNADILMKRLSDTYYPMKLKVSVNGNIIDVLNFDDIKKRWQDETSKIIAETSCIAFEQYIDSVKPTMQQKEKFLEAIKRDSFIQLYFMNFEDTLSVSCYNFPANGEVLHYQFYCNEALDGVTISKMYKAEDNNCKGTLLCKFSEFRDIISLGAEFVYISQLGLHTKSIHIRMKEREIKGSNNIISFFMD